MGQYPNTSVETEHSAGERMQEIVNEGTGTSKQPANVEARPPGKPL